MEENKIKKEDPLMNYLDEQIKKANESGDIKEIMDVADLAADIMLP